MQELINLQDFEQAALARLPAATGDYYASGACDELTLADNRAAFARLRLYYRVLVDVTRRETTTTALGHPLSMPAMIAPTAFHRLATPDGELATARAAAAAGTVMILSTLSNTPIEEVVAAAGKAPVWFQLYVYRDRGVTQALVERAVAAGCRALVLTVDAPLIGRRERDVRNRFRLPADLKVANLLPAGHAEIPAIEGNSGLAAYVVQLFSPAVTWADLEWLRGLSPLPIVLKGVVRPDDARRAADAGVAAVAVSNHGGRQLDSAVASIDALAAIAEAVGDQVELYVDGGVRRGTDVVKALALGARAVLLGRPVLWGLAVGGQAGVEQVLAILRRELDEAMALCGCPSLAEITRDLIAPG